MSSHQFARVLELSTFRDIWLVCRSMEQVQLVSKCFSRGGNLDHACCREFTVSFTGGKPLFGLLSSLVLVVSVIAKSQCLQQLSCPGGDVVWIAALVTVIVLYFWTYMSSIQKESLLLVMPLGLQMSTVRRSGRQDITWIPWCLIGNFMILDVITGQKVIFCLAVSVKESVDGQEKTLILFRNTKPRLHQLETIYRELQTSLDKYR